MPVANLSQLTAQYNNHRTEIKEYFVHLPKLINDFPYEVALAYAFSRVERAQRRALYCGIVKKYSANSDLTDEVTRNLYLSREEFLRLFEQIFESTPSAGTLKLLKDAEQIRDKGIHGKEPTNSEMRTALKNILDYATQFDDYVHSKLGFRPFGNLRGFKGRAENIDKKTTRLILKGLGLKIQ